MMGDPRHFLDIAEVSAPTLDRILDHSLSMKRARSGAPKGMADGVRPMQDRLLAMIFEKPSTRTRVSFDVAMRQLGGSTLILSAQELQLGRGETIADTARVLSRMVDAIMIRTYGHDTLRELADHATVPVINGLTDYSHPCQVMADVMTLKERKGNLEERVVAWSGDSANVTTSWIHAAARFGFSFRIASPPPLQPEPEVVAWARDAGADVTVGEDPREAVADADCVVTDTWVSIHQAESANRHNLLRPYQVNRQLMALARPDAIFMHCLPAHRGEEVSDDVIDGEQSVVFDEAENRLHIQKGILAWCLVGEQ